MLTPQLQKRLDEKWNNCWPVSDLRPLAILDLVSYMFFIKKLDDWELIHQKVKAAGTDSFNYSKEIEEFTWSKLQNLDARQIQQLFNKEHGIVDLMNNYAHLNALYSDFFKAPLLISPTAKLIFNAIEIINIIETSDKISQQSIVEFLFSKSKMATKNSQGFLPQYVSRLMISIADPEFKDIILDPCAGTGNLLINIHKHIADKNLESPSSSNKFIEPRVSGRESNLVLLRLAAMNMVLHGIKNPKIRFTPVESENLNEHPTLIISSLLFSTADSVTTENNSVGSNLEKENEILKEILTSLKPGGRAVILVPQVFLKSDNPAIIKTRRSIVDQFNLEAVITLDPKTDSLFSGAGILVFEMSPSSTENIWFRKWGTRKKKTRNEALSDNGDNNDNFDFNEVIDILNKWETRNEKQKDFSNKNFFISANYIQTNNYNLSFADYKLIRQEQPVNEETENVNIDENAIILAAKKENLNEFFEASEPLPEERKRRRLAPVLLVLLLVILGGAAYYWFYVKDNHHHLYTRNNTPDSSTNIKVSNTSNETQEDTAKVENTASSTEPQTTSPKPTPAGKTSASDGSTKYTIINKTWFHFGPDSSKLKPVFLEPGRDVVLTPKDEKNGFVYVVYVNSKGQATHGWLNKKDLEAVE